MDNLSSPPNGSPPNGSYLQLKLYILQLEDIKGTEKETSSEKKVLLIGPFLRVTRLLSEILVEFSAGKRFSR
jgi:hypothetical protein